MRWSSARIAWSVVVGLGLFVLLLCMLSDNVHQLARFDRFKPDKWTVISPVRILLPYLPAVGVLSALAIGLATGLLPDASWSGLVPSERIRARVARGLGWTFTLGVLSALVLAMIPTVRGGFDPRPLMVVAHEICVITGALLVWINLGGHRGAAIGTMFLLLAVLGAQSRWFPWWKRIDLSTIAGPGLAVHLGFSTLVTAAPVAFLMLLTANLKLAPAFRWAPGLAVVFVSGMFVVSGYLAIFSPFHSSLFDRSRTVTGHRTR